MAPYHIGENETKHKGNEINPHQTIPAALQRFAAPVAQIRCP